MFKILSDELYRVGLAWKSEAMELLRSGGCWGAASCCWTAAGQSFTIKLCEGMLILGVYVDSRGSSDRAAVWRVSQGWVHWHARKEVFCNSKIPLRLRWQRLRETVFRTILFGSGAWRCGDAILNLLQSTETKMLKLCLCRRPMPLETAEDFHHRMHSKIIELKKSFGWTDLAHLYLMQYFSFWGHVARMPKQAPLNQIMRWRGSEWMSC